MEKGKWIDLKKKWAFLFNSEYKEHPANLSRADFTKDSKVLEVYYNLHTDYPVNAEATRKKLIAAFKEIFHLRTRPVPNFILAISKSKGNKTGGFRTVVNMFVRTAELPSGEFLQKTIEGCAEPVGFRLFNRITDETKYFSWAELKQNYSVCMRLKILRICAGEKFAKNPRDEWSFSSLL